MIEYQRADIRDIDVLARMRVAFSYDGREVPEAEASSLLENNRQYFSIGMTDGSFVAWIALDDGKIIATSGLTIYYLLPNRGCPHGKTAYIGNMYTIPEYRRQGIVTKLFSLTVDEAKLRGCERILLAATDMGRPIYSKYGFECSSTAMAYYPCR